MTYYLDPKTNLWRRPDFTGINYSDGDEVENRLLAIVTAAADVGIFSSELQAACTDWPSRYHLSPARANLLRPIADVLKGDVLELGAGCGAITRFLGENGANVLALEGSERRATIARARTRDLDNVAIMVDDIGLASINKKFDVITLIGVLEYASLFTENAMPALALLERCRGWLKPDGVLVLAIENQLGLKYFAGAPEDHLGIANYGIEDRYSAREPRTFGRQSLMELLESVNLPNQSWYAPFPDYKLPAAVISQAGYAHPRFDVGTLAAQTAGGDPQLPANLVFQPESVWETVCSNGLGLDLANSFLVLARQTPTSTSAIRATKLGWHFNTGRAAAYCKQSVFQASEHGSINVVCSRLAPQVNPPDEATAGPLDFHLICDAEYHQGRLLWADFVQLVGRDGWTLAQVTEFFQHYLEILDQLVEMRDLPCVSDGSTEMMNGMTLDWIPKNIILDKDRNPVVIDEEWRYRAPFPRDFLLFRAISASLVDTSIIGSGAVGADLTPRQLVAHVLQNLTGQASFRNARFEELLKMEADIQQQVRGGMFDVQGMRVWFDTPIQQSKQRLITSLQRVTSSNQSLKESLDLVLSSRAWALTRPLRALNRLISQKSSK